MNPPARRPIRPRFELLEVRALLSGAGTPDPGFGDGYGFATIPVGVLTFGNTVTSPDVRVARLNADGTPDATFGTSGVAQLQAGSPTVTPALAIQPGGQVDVGGVGKVTTPSGRLFGLSAIQLLSAATGGGPAQPPPPAPPLPPASFDGSRLTNISIYDPTTGTFYYRPLNNPLPGSGDVAIQFGSAGVGRSIPAAADYLGNGTDQIAVYLVQQGAYAIRPVPGVTPGLFLPFGTKGVGQTIPVPADYEGAGKADVAVYLTASGTYAILPSNGSAGRLIQFGTKGVGQSIPAPADYYGTGQADVAVYLAARGAFAIQDPTGKTPGVILPFGPAGVGLSLPVPGDYDGSGKVELAVYVPSQGAFYFRSAITGKDVKVPFGTPNSGEIPAVGDYDGAGHDEFAVYDSARGFLAYRLAIGKGDVITFFGRPGSGSLPTAAPAGDLPPFNGSGGPVGSVIAPPVPAPSGPASPNSITATKSSAVPSGPTHAPARTRVPRSLINQAIPGDPQTSHA